jgi:hypothetical protein
MNTTNALGRLCDRIVPYETWRAPLTPGLRHAVILSGFSIFTTLICSLFLPVLASWSRSNFFWIGQSVFGGVVQTMYQWQTTLIVLNLLSLAVYFALLVATSQLQVGTAVWQQVAFAESSLGVVNTLVLALETSIVVVNVAIWIVFIAIAVSAALAGLAAGFRDVTR